MLPEQKQDIVQAPEVQELATRLTLAGATRSVVDAAINEALAGVSPGYREGVRLVTTCLLAKLKEYEQGRQPKTFFGKLLKRIFG